MKWGHSQYPVVDHVPQRKSIGRSPSFDGSIPIFCWYKTYLLVKPPCFLQIHIFLVDVPWCSSYFQVSPLKSWVFHSSLGQFAHRSFSAEELAGLRLLQLLNSRWAREKLSLFGVPRSEVQGSRGQVGLGKAMGLGDSWGKFRHL